MDRKRKFVNKNKLTGKEPNFFTYIIITLAIKIFDKGIDLFFLMIIRPSFFFFHFQSYLNSIFDLMINLYILSLNNEFDFFFLKIQKPYNVNIFNNHNINFLERKKKSKRSGIKEGTASV